MKGWLIFCAIAASSVVHAASTTANAQEQQRVAVYSKPVSTRPLPMQQSAPQQQTPAAVRHLNDEERAELRKQLQQFNRQYGKRS